MSDKILHLHGLNRGGKFSRRPADAVNRMYLRGEEKKGVLWVYDVMAIEAFIVLYCNCITENQHLSINKYPGQSIRGGASLMDKIAAFFF